LKREDLVQRARTYNGKCPAIVADNGRLLILEDGYFQREGDEREEYLSNVQSKLEAREVLRVPFELGPAHVVR
jgi:hypothetical protein